LIGNLTEAEWEVVKEGESVETVSYRDETIVGGDDE